MKIILNIAVIISIITYLLWEVIKAKTGISVFYLGNALFITSLCSVLFFSDRVSDVKFTLFALSLNNLFDELFFDNTLLQWNEIVFGVVIILIVLKRKYDKYNKRMGTGIFSIFPKNNASSDSWNSYKSRYDGGERKNNSA